MASLDCDSLVMVTSQLSNDGLYQELLANESQFKASGIVSADCIGDCYVPGTIAAAVYSGHQWARQLGEPPDAREVPFLREMVAI